MWPMCQMGGPEYFIKQCRKESKKTYCYDDDDCYYAVEEKLSTQKNM